MSDIEIKVNMKTGEITTVKGGVIYTGMAGFIASQRDMLCGYRDDGRVPSQGLLDDIKAYEYVLGGGEDLVAEYQAWKNSALSTSMTTPKDFLKHKGVG